MHIDQFREYCLSKKGVTEGFPFDEVTLVFKVMNKMFALASLDAIPPKVSLKCDPERAIELREQFDGRVLPGYHLNKQHWNTIFMEQIPAKLLLELTDHSYELIVASLPKKVQQTLRELQ
jgi:predicted DNA-binding protein (MmcQ/YjbR family)